MEELPGRTKVVFSPGLFGGYGLKLGFRKAFIARSASSKNVNWTWRPFQSTSNDEDDDSYSTRRKKMSKNRNNSDNFDGFIEGDFDHIYPCLVVLSMSTPISAVTGVHLYRNDNNNKTESGTIESEYSMIEVGDVLFAINGKQLIENSGCGGIEKQFRDALGLPVALHQSAVTLSNKLDALSKKISVLDRPLSLSFISANDYYKYLKEKIDEKRAVLKHEAERAAENSGILSTLASPIVYVVGGFWSSSDDTVEAKKVAALHNKVLLERPIEKSLNEVQYSLVGSERIGDRAFASGNLSEAIEIYSNGVLHINPTNHTVLCKRAIACLKKRQYDMCMRDATKCIALRPEWPMGYLFKGICLWRQKRRIESVASFVCGLCIDPQNIALLRAVALFFDATKLDILVLDKPEMLNDIGSALTLRGMENTQLDRVAVTSHPGVLEDLVPLQRITIGYGATGGGKNSVTKCDRVMIADVDAYSDAKGYGLRTGDVIMSVNGVSMENASYQHVNEALASTQSSDVEIRVIGLVNRFSSLLAAAKSDEYEDEENVRQKQLKMTSTIIISNSGVADANGIYIPQEIRNGVNVYQNEKGFMLSLEMLEGAIGWLIGKDGEIVYAKPLNPNGASSNVDFLRENAMKHLTDANLEWKSFGNRYNRSVKGPTVEYYGNLPSLESLISHEDDSYSSRTSGNRMDMSDYITKEWSPLLELVALKGYGFRAMSQTEDALNEGSMYNTSQTGRHGQFGENSSSDVGYDLAMKCFDIVIQRVSVLISIKKDSDVERSLLMNVLTNKGRLLLERKRNFAAAAECLSRARTIGKLLDPNDRIVNVMNDFHLALALSNLSTDRQKEALKICLYSIKYIQENQKDKTALEHFLSLEKTLVSVLNIRNGEDAEKACADNRVIVQETTADVKKATHVPPLGARPTSPIFQMRNNMVGRSRKFLNLTKKKKTSQNHKESSI